MIKACYFSDYFYYNHFGKCITFIFKSKKRVKTKVINFIKNNHQESEIIKFLEGFGLTLEVYAKSKKYIHYYIKDIESEVKENDNKIFRRK